VYDPAIDPKAKQEFTAKANVQTAKKSTAA
jgi:hypothetical protein